MKLVLLWILAPGAPIFLVIGRWPDRLAVIKKPVSMSLYGRSFS